MIRQGDRVLAVGNTGTGKSQALAELFARHAGQRLLIDVGDDYTLGPAALAEGASEADSPGAIDWSKRTIRYVPRRGDRREYDELYAYIWERGDLFVWADELEDVAPAHGTPWRVRKVVKQGRKRRLTHAGATQRPVGVDRSVVNQAEHAYIFRLVDRDDVDVLAFRVGIDSHALAAELRELPSPQDTYTGFLYHRVGQPSVTAFPPLPPAWVERARQHVVIPSR